MSNFLNTWSTKVTDHIPWSKKQDSIPYRVWVPGVSSDGDLSVIGIIASNLTEIKEKTIQYLRNAEKIDGNIKYDCVSILIFRDGTTIVDDDYLQQLPQSEDLLLLLPGQTWSNIYPRSVCLNGPEITNNKSLISQNALQTASKSTGKNLDYFVPTPDGEVARLTFDIYREHPSDAGCVRVTAAAAGDARMTVSYELKLNGAKTILHYGLRWTSLLLIYGGKLMVDAGEVIKGRLS